MLPPASPAPLVFLAFPEDYPDAGLAAVLADFAVPTGCVQVQQMEWLPTSARAWTEPTAVTANLGAAFVATLQPGGATAETPALLAGLQALAIRSHGPQPAFLADWHRRPKHRRYHQSEAFAIVAQGQGGQRIKMLFDAALSPAAWSAAIADVLFVVAVHYLRPPAPASVAAAALAVTPTPMLYVVYNRTRKSWEVQDDTTMQAMHRNG